MSGKNDFTKEENRKKCKYKLWMRFTPQAESKYPYNPMTWFSFNSKKDGGLQMLLNLAKTKKDDYHIAILYDNQNPDKEKNELQRFRGVPYPNKKKKPRITRVRTQEQHTQSPAQIGAIAAEMRKKNEW